VIVKALHKHLNAIDTIYNQAIADGQRTAHMEPLAKAEREAWFENHQEDKYPVFVWLEAEQVLGWISISPYRAGRQALDGVAEVSYYVHFKHHGKGIGSKLMKHTIAFCKRQDFHTLVAIMVSGNEASNRLAASFGFVESGRIKKALRYDETIRDHVYMSLRLD
jgi:phosphinothricin acetyltransferase